MSDDFRTPDPADEELLGLAAAADAPARTPSAELRTRIMRDLAAYPLTTLRAGEGIWLPSPESSVATRLLYWDSADAAATRLVRLAPGHTLPPAMLDGLRTVYVVAGVIHSSGGTLESGEFAEEARPAQDWRARRPSTVLESSLARRTGSGLRVAGAAQRAWQPMTRGIRASTLMDAHDGREVLLIRAEPGAVLEAHDHAGVEELYVLEGNCVIEELQLGVGDYHRAASSSHHHATEAGPDGCLLYCSVHQKRAS